ncbi:MAG: hypothetical protein JWO27_1809 [Frankiales bacterium]|nr:hypothetical protein [Frankiales bacterium]MCW2706187.1 hypothetical protein [Frankiales bacterium]
MTTLTNTSRSTSPNAAPPALTTRRLNVMRAGYAFMGLGLAIVEWPRVFDARSLPLFEGVVVCILTAMSLLALLGLRHPTRLLPVLLFECAWKALWLLAVAAPTVVAGNVDEATSSVIFNCSLVVVILAVVPWRYAWTLYVSTPGEPWKT